MDKKYIFVLAFIVVVIGMQNVLTLQGADFAIYTGAGTWRESIIAFENFLNWKGLTWEEVNKDAINRGQIIGKYRGLFMPGGWAGDYNRDIKPSGDQYIRDFISQGGAYIGMSAGAFYACDVTIWEGSVLDYPSNIFDGDCIGPIDEIAPWPNYIMTTMNMNLAHEANIYEPVQRDVLYYGEPYFVAHSGQEMQTFASWIVPTNPVANNKSGIIGFNYGSGRVLLVGPHPEIEEDDFRDGSNFGEELSDGPDGSDWPFLWTSVDWLLKNPISIPPGNILAQCNDGVDNDNDTFVDYPSDIGCSSFLDNDEVDSLPSTYECSDGLDNDFDNLTDFPNDPDCTSLSDDNEAGLPSGQIFFDDFETGTLSGWIATAVSGANKWIVSTLSPYQGAYSAYSKPMSTANPASVLEKTISTAGYGNIKVSYYRKLVGLDSADEFQAEWFDGANWQILEQTGSNSANNANYIYKEFAIPGSAGNNPDFKVKFECTAGAVSEYCLVDNVKVFA